MFLLATSGTRSYPLEGSARGSPASAYDARIAAYDPRLTKTRRTNNRTFTDLGADRAGAASSCDAAGTYAQGTSTRPAEGPGPELLEDTVPPLGEAVPVPSVPASPSFVAHCWSPLCTC